MTIDVSVDDAPRELMIETLEDELGEEFVDELLKQVLRQQITQAYDNRESLKEQVGGPNANGTAAAVEADTPPVPDA